MEISEIGLDRRQVAESLSLVREPRHLQSLTDQCLRGTAAIAIMRDLGPHGALGLPHRTS